MKKTTFLLLLLAGLALSFTATGFRPQDTDKSLAKVNQYQGIYVFIDSTPVREYEYVGTVKPPAITPSNTENHRDNMVKKARKEFPNAEAIILPLPTGKSDNATAIRFK